MKLQESKNGWGDNRQTVGGGRQARKSSFLSREFWAQTRPAGGSRVSVLCADRRQDHLWGVSGCSHQTWGVVLDAGEKDHPTGLQRYFLLILLRG